MSTCRNFVSILRISEVRKQIVWRLSLYIIIFWFESNFNFWKKCIHQMSFLSACNIERSFISMMKIDTMNYFLTTQSIISLNNSKIYSSTFFRSRSFAKNASIVFLKICLSLFFLFDNVFLFNFEFDVDDISLFDFILFEFEIWLLSFSLFEFE
jgi:hypothetical protein